MDCVPTNYYCYRHDPDSDTHDVSGYVQRKGLHFIAPLHMIKESVVLFHYARDMNEDMLTGFFQTANAYQLSLLLVYTKSYDAFYHNDCHIAMDNIDKYLPALDMNAYRRPVVKPYENLIGLPDDMKDYHPNDADNFLSDMETVSFDETDSDVDIAMHECFNPFCSHFYCEELCCKGCGDMDYPYELFHDKFMYQSMDEGFVSFNSYVQLYFKCNSTVKSKERVPSLMMLMHLYGIPFTSYISIIKVGSGSLVHYYEFDDWMDIVPIFIESLSRYGDEFVITFLCREEVKAMQKLKNSKPEKRQKYHDRYAKYVMEHLREVGNAYYLQKQVILPITSDVFMSHIFENVDETLQAYSENEKWGSYMTHVLENYLVADSLSESNVVHAYCPWMKELEFPTFVDQMSDNDDSDFELADR